MLAVVFFLVTSVTGNGLLIETTSVQAAAGQETEPISNQITHARDQIENDLKKLGKIIVNEIKVVRL
jgi:hypothetical protein